jgi:hypothetical protein
MRYKAIQQGQFEYIHEFKERIDEILWLQKKHQNIIDTNPNPSVQQTSLAELHRLKIALNYFDVAPDIIGHYHTSVIRNKDNGTTNKNHRLTSLT